MGSCDLERGAWSSRRIPLSATVEGVLDHVCTSYDLVYFGAVLGQDAGLVRKYRTSWLGFDNLWRRPRTAVEAGLKVKSS